MSLIIEEEKSEFKEEVIHKSGASEDNPIVIKDDEVV